MSETPQGVSNAFQTFFREAPKQAAVWSETVRRLDEASALDPKTEELAYLAVMASASLLTGIPFHVAQAKHHGATREELISAILVGLPAVGNRVIQALPAALEAYDAPEMP